jgi:hypothetical protein
MNKWKIIIIYFLILSLFYVVQSNVNRFILSTLLYIFSIFIFDIDYKLGCLYFLIGCGAAFTEHIFIRHISLSWDYREPNFYTIPLWLIPLWSLAIILILEMISLFTDMRILVP